MASRQVSRATECFAVSWSEPLEATSLAEADAPEIGAFLLRVGHPLRPECEAGTIEGASFYVTRLFGYHQADRSYDIALRASTIVRDASSGQVIGVCLVGGGGGDGQMFSIYDIQVDPARQRQGIGTNMIKRALYVLAERGVAEFHLWHEDDAPVRAWYERLGFKPTGAVE